MRGKLLGGFTGAALATIGALHLLLGVLMAGDLGAALASGRVANAVESQNAPGIALEFWFLMFGFPLVILGHLAAWVERRLNQRLPAFLGWELLGFAGLGAILDPDSGFWLLLVVAVVVLLRALHAPSAPVISAGQRYG